jgi:hypothetical protein
MKLNPNPDRARGCPKGGGQLCGESPAGTGKTGKKEDKKSKACSSAFLET